jgi:hypothetical protein
MPHAGTSGGRRRNRASSRRRVGSGLRPVTGVIRESVAACGLSAAWQRNRGDRLTARSGKRGGYGVVREDPVGEPCTSRCASAQGARVRVTEARGGARRCGAVPRCPGGNPRSGRAAGDRYRRHGVGDHRIRPRVDDDAAGTGAFLRRARPREEHPQRADAVRAVRRDRRRAVDRGRLHARFRHRQ